MLGPCFYSARLCCRQTASPLQSFMRRRPRQSLSPAKSLAVSGHLDPDLALDRRCVAGRIEVARRIGGPGRTNDLGLDPGDRVPPPCRRGAWARPGDRRHLNAEPGDDATGARPARCTGSIPATGSIAGTTSRPGTTSTSRSAAASILAATSMLTATLPATDATARRAGSPWPASNQSPP